MRPLSFFRVILLPCTLLPARAPSARSVIVQGWSVQSTFNSSWIFKSSWTSLVNYLCKCITIYLASWCIFLGKLTVQNFSKFLKKPLGMNRWSWGLSTWWTHVDKVLYWLFSRLIIGKRGLHSYSIQDLNNVPNLIFHALCDDAWKISLKCPFWSVSDNSSGK